MHFGILEAILSLFFFALLVSLVFRQLKLSVVLGYLLVGALAGPHAFALVPNTEYINRIAEFGIVFLMFTVGLEFSIPKLFSLKHAVFVVGTLQVTLCVVLTTLIGVFFFGMSTPASVVIGSIVAMSSTALVIKQLNEQFELQTPYGLNAVGILLFQDIAFIPLIILISSLSKPYTVPLAVTLLWALFKGALAIFLIFILGRWLLRPLFHYLNKARSIELFTLTVLLVAISAAWITHILGLSYALGAFLAGVMLAETEFRHQIEVEIRPFRDILLALFFITIGMLTDVTVWDDTWMWIGLLLLGLILGKMILIILLSRLTGNYLSNSIRTGIVLAQGGEFSFVILTFALMNNIIPESYAQVILAALLISIAVSPILIHFNKQIADILLPKSAELQDSITQQAIIQEAKKLHYHIVICGYGRVGQHIARLLDKINFPYIAIDFDAELVQRASLAGDNVIYGDASRPEILEIAGISQAKAMVVSIRDHRAASSILSIVRQLYPKLPTLIRCHDKSELKSLRKIGASFVIAEIFEASLSMSHHLLQMLQMPRDKINKLIQEVRNSDYELLHKVFAGDLDEEPPQVETDYHEELNPVVIPEDAYAVAHSLEELNLKNLMVEVVAIRRGAKKHIKPEGSLTILPNDIVVLYGSRSALELAERRLLEGE